MKQIQYVQRTPDELDLTVLLGKAINFFRYYGKIIAGVALVGLLAGLLRFWYTPNIYSSALVVQPALLSDPEQMEVINSWSKLLKKKELPALAHQWNINKNLLKKINAISVEELQKSYTPGNFTAITITALVKDTSVLNPLQKGLLYGLNNSEYVKEKLVAKRNLLTTLIQTTQQEINRLYKWQSTVETNMQSTSGGNGRIIVNPSDISTQITALQEKKLAFEEDLSFNTAVHVLQNFYIPTKPTYPILIRQLLLGLAGGLMLGGVLAFYLYLRKRMYQA
jgi:uncharacterized protein involved in exopolysaccharide biosynthesis